MYMHEAIDDADPVRIYAKGQRNISLCIALGKLSTGVLALRSAQEHTQFMTPDERHAANRAAAEALHCHDLICDRLHIFSAIGR
jgi:hypothetical protein